VSNRPRLLVVVAGTGTSVGKTWLTCQLCQQLRASGLKVAARKPAQSFDPGDESPTDAELLAAATGEKPAEVCPPRHWYAKAMAPPMAAESMGLPPLLLGDLLEAACWPSSVDVGFVELAGGVGSPQAADADGAAAVAAFSPERVVLVSHAGLGALSDVRLATRALGGYPLVVYLNRFDPSSELHLANERWLVAKWGLRVATGTSYLSEVLRSEEIGHPGGGPAEDRREGF
jgi:dethiobiotin synthetase